MVLENRASLPDFGKSERLANYDADFYSRYRHRVVLRHPHRFIDGQVKINTSRCARALLYLSEEGECFDI